MRSKTKMEKTITFRANDEEIAAYSQTWQKLGYKSQSEFHRTAGNMLVSGGNDKKHYGVNPTMLTATNTHLDRLSAMISELLVQTANDNFPNSPHFARALNAALSDIKVIRRKVS